MARPRQPSTNPSIAILGAGRVGRALGHLLHEQGWQIGDVVTRSRTRSRAAVRAIGDGNPSDSLTFRILASDVILISTPDDAVAPVAARLARLARRALHAKVVLHCSGALDSSVLDPLRRLGASTGSLHPLQAFGSHAIPSLEGVLFSIEGQPRARQLARCIARILGGTPVRIDARHKPAYHAAGGFAAAHLLAILEAGTRMLTQVGYSRRHAILGLANMARYTIDTFERFGPHAALSGPLARGDFRTIQKHVAALRSQPREIRDAYAALMRLGASLLSPHPPATLRRLNRILSRVHSAQ